MMAVRDGCGVFYHSDTRLDRISVKPFFISPEAWMWAITTIALDTQQQKEANNGAF